MSWLELAVYAAATWRVTSILNDEDGPNLVVERMRHRAGVRRTASGKQFAPAGSFGAMMICPACASVAVGLLWAILAAFAGRVGFYAALPFALSTAAILLHRAKEWLPVTS